MKKEPRKPPQGKSGKYIPKYRKGLCQYVYRQNYKGKIKGGVCGRIGKIREDGTCICCYHVNHADRLHKLKVKRIRAMIKRPEKLKRLRETIQISTEELHDIPPLI
jgi:hypothetical protein